MDAQGMATLIPRRKWALNLPDFGPSYFPRNSHPYRYQYLRSSFWDGLQCGIPMIWNWWILVILQYQRLLANMPFISHESSMISSDNHWYHIPILSPFKYDIPIWMAYWFRQSLLPGHATPSPARSDPRDRVARHSPGDRTLKAAARLWAVGLFAPLQTGEGRKKRWFLRGKNGEHTNWHEFTKPENLGGDFGMIPPPSDVAVRSSWFTPN